MGCRHGLGLIFFLIWSFFGVAQKPLNIYGGKDHDVFLGCLNCNSMAPASIWNAYGTYGSKYSATSIWNKYATYGSDYGDNSPFNQHASYPPAIVDKDGNFFGYLTVNEYHEKRAEFPLAVTICKFYDMIRDDVSKWYDKIFK